MVKKQKELIDNCVALPITKFANGAPEHGAISLSGYERRIDARYEMIGSFISLQYEKKEQCLETLKIPAFRGVKTFFICECDKRCRFLFLRSDGERFACRSCNDLIYASHSLMDRRTVNGGILSDSNRLMRLFNRREKMRSTWYRGKPTKNFLKLLSDADKYGFYGCFAAKHWESIEDLELKKKAVAIARGM